MRDGKSDEESVRSPCFYHLAMPGHDMVEVDEAAVETIPEADWHMDRLAAKVNRAVRQLDFQGRLGTPLSYFILFTDCCHIPLTSSRSLALHIASHLRYILMGEGAGANIVTRSACEEKQRDIDDYNSLRPRVKTGALMTGLVCLQPNFNGPTVGDNLSGGVGNWLLKVSR